MHIGVVPLKYGEHSILVTLSTSGARLAECSMIVTEYCTVSFESGEGTGTMDSAEVASGNAYSLPECGFTAPEGMEFDSWLLNGTKMLAGDSAIIDDDCEAVALWSEASASIDDGLMLWIAAALAIAVMAAASAIIVLRGRAK